jgi:hypothetical protein
MWPDRRNFLDELFDGHDSSHWPTAAGATRQRHVHVLIDLSRDRSMRSWMPRRPTGWLLGTIGYLLGRSPPEWGSLPDRGLFGLIKALAKLTNLLKRCRKLRPEFSILTPQFLDNRFWGVHTRIHPSDDLPIP